MRIDLNKMITSNQSFKLYNFQAPKHNRNIARISLADNIKIDQFRLLRSALLTTLQPARRKHEPHLVPTRHRPDNSCRAKATKQTRPTNGYVRSRDTKTAININPTTFELYTFQTLEQKSYIAQKNPWTSKQPFELYNIRVPRPQKLYEPKTISCLSTSKIDQCMFLRSTLLMITQPVRQ